MLNSAQISSLYIEVKDFIAFGDASRLNLGDVLMQNLFMIVYALGKLKPYAKNYPIHDLELAVVVFVLKI